MLAFGISDTANSPVQQYQRVEVDIAQNWVPGIIIETNTYSVSVNNRLVSSNSLTSYFTEAQRDTMDAV
jgi:hypothetical protein